MESKGQIDWSFSWSLLADELGAAEEIYGPTVPLLPGCPPLLFPSSPSRNKMHVAAWSVRPRPESNQKKKWVRKLRVRFVCHSHQFPYNRVALSLWPRRACLPPSSFSHQFRAAAKCHMLWSAPWESCSSFPCWQKEPRETSPFSKRFDDYKPLASV